MTTLEVRIATALGSEEALLCRVDGVIYALLVPLQDGDEARRWYLHTGFGCCEQEGLIFGSLDEAAIWIDDCIARRDR